VCHAPRVTRIFGLVLVAGVGETGANGWYVGAGIAKVSSNYRFADFDDGPISSSSAANNDSAWRLFVDYALNTWFSVETSYSDLHNSTDGAKTFSGISDGTGNRYGSLPDCRCIISAVPILKRNHR